jgi:signal transduction histidine kinase
MVPTGEHWGERNVTLVNLVEVDLGTNVIAEAEKPVPPIVLSRDEIPRPPGTNRPPPSPPGLSGADLATASNSVRSSDSRPSDRGGRPGGRDGRSRFGPPPWMIQKKGVHSFAIKLSTQSMREATNRDLWLRSIICILASVSVVGLGLAWRTVTQSSELEVRLVRASELNTRLKEMNLAAAGLAHETRNPLNIIRGLAHMISKRPDSPPEICQKSREIIDETDRVTAQLNDFIDFSRPREVRRSAVALNAAVAEVVRALGSDIEEKAVRLEVAPDLPAIMADEQLLRQALFNLLINAIQAVDRNGEIRVVAAKNGGHEARLEIRDNGPGVPPDQRTEVFKPYFTTHAGGTGLGLAVVQQIVLAHGWEIACLPNEPRGAIFQIAHLKLAA